MASLRSPLRRKLGQFSDLDTGELALVEALETPARRVPAGQVLFGEGDPPPACYVILAGWAAMYKLLGDGRRQIITFGIPGDFLGVRSLLLRVSDHATVAVTELTLSEFSNKRFMDLVRDGPRVAAAIMWTVSREEAIVVEHLVNVGRRNALERTAHFFLELGKRLEAVGLGERERFACPLIQEDLADALGLTSVHLNRVLRQLRERGLLTLARREITIHDIDALGDLAQFSSAYLDQHEDD